MSVPRRVALIRLPDEPTVEELEERFRRDVEEPGGLFYVPSAPRPVEEDQVPDLDLSRDLFGTPSECASQSTVSGNLKNIYFISGVN